ncbi:hypothetical protein BD414DRAFT_542398 [Trametes punicea]|nr:hypothetical protein BD414DRAFT_542398 [Trametes punicea]
MSPVTRSRRNAQASSSKITLDRDEDVLSDHPSVGIASPNEAAEPEPSSDHTTLESLLTRALGGAKQLQRENASLHKKVKALEAKLDRVINADDAPLQPQRGKRTAASVAELRSQIAQLRKQVRRLERSNEKQRKRIHQLSLKELKTEAEDLVDAAEFEVGDSAYKMRKLLRRFHDLMLENSLDENEECLICMEPLQPRKSRRQVVPVHILLPCQHTFCDSCVRQLPSEPGEPESIRCPTCRAVCLREEAELVQYTASEQWDALLDVAKQWAKMDVRREEETTEEEDAEQFIDDELEETTSVHALHYFWTQSNLDPPNVVRLRLNLYLLTLCKALLSHKDKHNKR